jgi:hypothetical protein
MVCLYPQVAWAPLVIPRMERNPNVDRIGVFCGAQDCKSSKPLVVRKCMLKQRLKYPQR